MVHPKQNYKPQGHSASKHNEGFYGGGRYMGYRGYRGDIVAVEVYTRVGAVRGLKVES